MKQAEGSSLRSWNNADTKDCRLRVVNGSDLGLDVLWVQPDGIERSYRKLQPGGVHLQATYTTHVWRLRGVLTRRLLLEHVGGDTTIELLPDDGTVRVHNGFRQDIVPRGTPKPKEWGEYRNRAMSAIGIPIMAWDVVGDDAVVAAADILERMCKDTPADVLQRTVDAGCDVAIIGRNQVTSDIPAHSSLKGEDAGGSGRTFDDGCRGVGGSLLIPTTSAGEENCTMVNDRWYPSEQILIHEFGHTIMDVGLLKAQRDAIVAAYQAARKQQLYHPDCYMASNESEYWAEGVQAWFDATVRTDVNTGINTRAKLKRHDPTLAGLLAAAFGDGSWRYPQSAPQPFMQHSTAGRSKQQPGCMSVQRLGIRRLFGRCLPGGKQQYTKVV